MVRGWWSGIGVGLGEALKRSIQGEAVIFPSQAAIEAAGDGAQANLLGNTRRHACTTGRQDVYLSYTKAAHQLHHCCHHRRVDTLSRLSRHCRRGRASDARLLGLAF